MTRHGAVWQLWNLIARACWPQPAGSTGMGTTKISKLMAAKRPSLIPVHDSRIRDAVFGGKDPDNYWEPWTQLTGHPRAPGSANSQPASGPKPVSAAISAACGSLTSSSGIGQSSTHTAKPVNRQPNHGRYRKPSYGSISLSGSGQAISMRLAERGHPPYHRGGINAVC